MKKRGEDGLVPIGAIMRQAGMAPPSAHKLRLIDAAVTIAAGEDEGEIAYHHTVFCQTALPYRRVEEQIWERNNGFLSLLIEAGRALHPETRKWVNLHLPFGPKVRLIQIHLDTQAKVHDKPMVELEGSMTSFIKQFHGRPPKLGKRRLESRRQPGLAAPHFTSE